MGSGIHAAPPRELRLCGDCGAVRLVGSWEDVASAVASLYLRSSPRACSVCGDGVERCGACHQVHRDREHGGPDREPWSASDLWVADAQAVLGPAGVPILEYLERRVIEHSALDALGCRPLRRGEFAADRLGAEPPAEAPGDGGGEADTAGGGTA